MSDMLVRLYDLDKFTLGSKEPSDYKILRPLTASKTKVLEFVEKNFGRGWRDEADACFSRLPSSIFVAVNNEKEILGFACFETTARGFFGPTGVREDMRGRGIGKALLFESLKGLREMGYAYAFIGDSAPDVLAFYEKTCGAAKIDGSEKSVYINLL